MIVARMRNVQISSKVIQKGSLHQMFTIPIPSSILTTGTILLSSGSLLYRQVLTCWFHVHQYHQMDFVNTRKFLEYSSSTCRKILAFLTHHRKIITPQELLFMSGWSCSCTYFKQHLRHR